MQKKAISSYDVDVLWAKYRTKWEINWLACYIECCDCFQLTSIAIPIWETSNIFFFYISSISSDNSFFCSSESFLFSFFYFTSLSTVFSPAEQHTFWFIFQRLFLLKLLLFLAFFACNDLLLFFWYHRPIPHSHIFTAALSALLFFCV